MTSNIENKVVVITGASSGIGEATARLLANQGAAVAIAARRTEKLEAIAQQIASAQGKVKPYTVDVTSKKDVEGLVAGVVRDFGRLDVMVNNAGLMAIAPLSRGLSDEWDRMIDINIKGVLYGIAAALPVFEKQGFGHFINVASVAGHRVGKGGAVYSGTKFAVRAISEGLRQEVGSAIRTTIISPGAVESELPLGTSDESTRAGLLQFYQQAISADAVARAIAYALEQPADVDINEVLLRPTSQES